MKKGATCTSETAWAWQTRLLIRLIKIGFVLRTASPLNPYAPRWQLSIPHRRDKECGGTGTPYILYIIFLRHHPVEFAKQVYEFCTQNVIIIRDDEYINDTWKKQILFII